MNHSKIFKLNPYYLITILICIVEFEFIIICIGENNLLAEVYPENSISIFFHIPFWIICYFLFIVYLNKFQKKYNKKIIFCTFHIITFHLMLLSWPQSSLNQKNLLVEFYNLFF